MNNVKKIAVTAMLFAVGIVLPFITGQIPAIGRMLLPMHIPVLLCGFIVGWQYGAAIGFLLPIVTFLVRIALIANFAELPAQQVLHHQFFWCILLLSVLKPTNHSKACPRQNCLF